MASTQHLWAVVQPSSGWPAWPATLGEHAFTINGNIFLHSHKKPWNTKGKEVCPLSCQPQLSVISCFSTRGTRIIPRKRDCHIFSLLPSGTVHYFLAAYDFCILNVASLFFSRIFLTVTEVLVSFYSVRWSAVFTGNLGYVFEIRFHHVLQAGLEASFLLPLHDENTDTQLC